MARLHLRIARELANGALGARNPGDTAPGAPPRQELVEDVQIQENPTTGYLIQRTRIKPHSYAVMLLGDFYYSAVVKSLANTWYLFILLSCGSGCFGSAGGAV